jgi:hypothetical protein
MRWFYPIESAEARAEENQLEALRQKDSEKWREAMAQGGFGEAVTRMILAVMLADRDLTREGYELAGRLFRSDARLKQIDPRRLKSIILSQARILQTDSDRAIATLPALIPEAQDRRQALELLDAAIREWGVPLNLQERAVRDRIGEVMGGSDPVMKPDSCAPAA